MDRIVNWELISDPRNWVIVFIILYLVVLIAHTLYMAAGSAPIALPAGIGV